MLVMYLFAHLQVDFVNSSTLVSTPYISFIRIPLDNGQCPPNSRERKNDIP